MDPYALACNPFLSFTVQAKGFCGKRGLPCDWKQQPGRRTFPREKLHRGSTCRAELHFLV